MLKKDFASTNGTAVSVYFLGSGRLAVPVLKSLRENSRINLTGVGTQLDKPAGRRRRPNPTAVGDYALSTGLLVHKIASVNSPEFRNLLSCPEPPDIIVVTAFGQILRHEVLNFPKFGCLNVHASLLPAYRGAAPIETAILAGNHQTGISFMQMDPGLDTGPVYEKHHTPIGVKENKGELEERLGELAGGHIVKVIEKICQTDLKPLHQAHDKASLAPKIKKQAGFIDWSRPAVEIGRAVKAYEPWPRVTFYINLEKKGWRRIQIVEAMPVTLKKQKESGTVCLEDDGSLVIACGRGGIKIEKLLPEGSRSMNGAEFLNGHRPIPGSRIYSGPEKPGP